MIKKILENQSDKTEAELAVTPCLCALGDLQALYDMANIWEVHKETLKLIGINEFIVWSKNKFNSEQKDAFMEGLSAYPEFLAKCLKEKQLKELEPK